jgi:hypothetical protein
VSKRGKKKVSDDKQALKVWEAWLMGMDCRQIASHFNLDTKTVLGVIKEGLESAAKVYGDVVATAQLLRSEKVIAQLERVEAKLWTLYLREEREYLDAVATDAPETVIELHLQRMMALLEQLRLLLIQKATQLKNLGFVPPVGERRAALVLRASAGGSVSIDFAALEGGGRIPVRAEIENGENEPQLEKEEVKSLPTAGAEVYEANDG